MAKRLGKFLARLTEEANSSSGVFGLFGGLAGVVAFGAGAPVIVTATPVVIAGGFLGWCLYKALPEKGLDPVNLVGTVLTNLADLSRLDPQLTKIGFLGASRAGKTTTLANLSAIVPNAGVRTDAPYARISSLPGHNNKLFAMVDAAGQQYSQQFRVADEADLILVFFDHNANEADISIDQARLAVHVEFLRQLEGHIQQRGRAPARIHFVLNKKDKWSQAPDAQTLTDWFNALVAPWRRLHGIQVTTADHSNFVVADNTALINFLRDHVV